MSERTRVSPVDLYTWYGAGIVLLLALWQVALSVQLHDHRASWHALLNPRIGSEDSLGVAIVITSHYDSLIVADARDQYRRALDDGELRLRVLIANAGLPQGIDKEFLTRDLPRQLGYSDLPLVLVLDSRHRLVRVRSLGATR